MTEIKELTKIQYEILIRMSSSWCFGFAMFNDLGLTKKELSKEFKILKEAGLVFYARGLMTEEGEVAGSGYGIDDEDKTWELTEKWEEKNLPRTSNLLKRQDKQ